MKILFILQILLNNIEINYACKDQHIDAVFDTLEEANIYAEYYKTYHNYEIIPFFVVNYYSEL